MSQHARHEVQPASWNGVIDIAPAKGSVDEQSATLLATEQLEIVRLPMPTGKEIATYSATGEMIVHCLKGRVRLTSRQQSRELSAGQFVHIPPDEPQSIRGLRSGLLLLTILRPCVERDETARARGAGTMDVVDEASEESFPASDAPAWTGVTRP